MWLSIVCFSLSSDISLNNIVNNKKIDSKLNKYMLLVNNHDIVDVLRLAINNVKIITDDNIVNMDKTLSDLDVLIIDIWTLRAKTYKYKTFVEGSIEYKYQFFCLIKIFAW